MARSARMQQRPRNPYSSAEIDRASHERENDERMIELAASGEARFVPIDSEKNFVSKGGGNPEAVFLQGMMARAVISVAEHHIFLGYVEGTPYFAVDVTGKETPLGEMGEFVDLRQVGSLLFAREGSILAYARGMTYWHRRHRYCGLCGAPTRVIRAGHVRLCTNENCRTEHFPRTDPAVIMLVTDPDDRCLLARNAAWPGRRVSILAGFVDPGESAEQAVIREVAEETGIKVTNVRYVGSQPWPMPRSLMLGFRADAPAGQAIAVDHDELAEAYWFSRDELLAAIEAREIALPPPVSIARHIIESWFGGPLPSTWPDTFRPRQPS